MFSETNSALLGYVYSMSLVDVARILSFTQSHSLKTFIFKVLHDEHEHLLLKFQDVPLDQLSNILQKVNSFELTSYLNNLLSGVLWGILYQYHALAYQKKLFHRMLQDETFFKNEIIEVVQTLEDYISGRRNDRLSRRIPKNGIFKFRRFVIVILVVNRLSKMKSCKSFCSLQQKPSYGHNGLMIFTQGQFECNLDHDISVLWA